jgi:hypothetical protein
VLRIFRSNREEDGENYIMSSFIICNLYPLVIIRVVKSRRMRWAKHVARMTAIRNRCRIIVEKPEGKRLLGRTRYT